MENQSAGIWQAVLTNKAKVFTIALAILTIIGLPLSIFVARQRQDLRQQAAVTPVTCTPSSTSFGAELISTQGTASSSEIHMTYASGQLTYTFTNNIERGTLVTAAHIHNPAANPDIDDAPATVTLFQGSPDSFSAIYQGNVSVSQTTIDDMRNGRAYVNIHTQAFPNGEIRGRVVCEGTGTGPTDTPVPTLPQTPTATPTQTAPTPTPKLGSAFSGNIFLDANRNGVKDSGEAGMADVTIAAYLGSSATGIGDRADINGNYVISTVNLSSETYRLQVAEPQGYVATTPNPVTGLVYPPSHVINFGLALEPTPTTAPPTPTQTPQTRLTFTLNLHGLGTGGDSVNPNSTGNTSPLTPSRAFTVRLFDVSNTEVANASGTITFNTTTGKFTTVSAFTEPVASGSYTVAIDTSRYLPLRLPGITTITSGQNHTVPVTDLIAGDVNDDNQLDILDYNVLIGCYSDLQPARNCPSQTVKTASDITDDGNVNQFDLNLFLREISVRRQ